MIRPIIYRALPVIPLLLVGWRLPAQGLSPPEILDRMEEAFRVQQQSLESWTSVRVYSAGNNRLKLSVKARVQLDYSSPGSKTYQLIEHTGSKLVLDHVIVPALEAERLSAIPETRIRADINRQNYDLKAAGFDVETNSYLFDATPHSPGRYHFRGRVWVDAETFGVRRVRGAPAVSPSFWVRHSEFTQEYRRYGEFWLPQKIRSNAELRLFGLSTMEIDYGEYRLSARQEPAASAAAIRLLAARIAE
jgi:hypothetical protein